VVPKCPRHFGTNAEVSRGHFGTSTEVSRIFTVVPKCPMDTSAPVPKCLGSEVS